VRDEHRQYHVGIEMISRTVSLVRVGQSAGREPQTAILLSDAPDEKGEVGIIMRAGRFDPGAAIDVTLRDEQQVLAPTQMVDAGEDFDWARYRITA
jgi:D-alanyl-D-alanine dipeptidase